MKEKKPNEIRCFIPECGAYTIFPDANIESSSSECETDCCKNDSHIFMCNSCHDITEIVYDINTIYHTGSVIKKDKDASDFLDHFTEALILYINESYTCHCGGRLMYKMDLDLAIVEAVLIKKGYGPMYTTTIISDNRTRISIVFIIDTPTFIRNEPVPSKEDLDNLPSGWVWDKFSIVFDDSVSTDTDDLYADIFNWASSIKDAKYVEGDL